MSVYIDVLRNWGWKYGSSCHLITDGNNEELHEFATRLGLKRSWFQCSSSGPHYDLTARKRMLAVRLGAIELEDRLFHKILKHWREAALVKLKAAKDEEERKQIRSYLYR